MSGVAIVETVATTVVSAHALVRFTMWMLMERGITGLRVKRKNRRSWRFTTLPHPMEEVRASTRHTTPGSSPPGTSKVILLKPG
jgi:hypothetical protein